LEKKVHKTNTIESLGFQLRNGVETLTTFNIKLYLPENSLIYTFTLPGDKKVSKILNYLKMDDYNGDLYVLEAEVNKECPKGLPEKYYLCNKPGTYRIMKVSPKETIGKIKQIIEQNTGMTNLNLYYKAGRLYDGTSLSEYSTTSPILLSNDNNMQMGPSEAYSFAKLVSPKVLTWNEAADEWRMATRGLSLEGNCNNKTCKAYKKKCNHQQGQGREL